jgi:mRNA degradation ribonuclease J1/J2
MTMSKKAERSGKAEEKNHRALYDHPKFYVMVHGSASHVQRMVDKFMEDGLVPYGMPFTSGGTVRVGEYGRETEVFQAMIRPMVKQV